MWFRGISPSLWRLSRVINHSTIPGFLQGAGVSGRRSYGEKPARCVRSLVRADMWRTQCVPVPAGDAETASRQTGWVMPSLAVRKRSGAVSGIKGRRCPITIKAHLTILNTFHLFHKWWMTRHAELFIILFILINYTIIPLTPNKIISVRNCHRSRLCISRNYNKLLRWDTVKSSNLQIRHFTPKRNFKVSLTQVWIEMFRDKVMLFIRI